MSERTFCAVCGASIDIPNVRPRSDTWSHSDPAKCIVILRAQRETLQSEVAAWQKRATQAEAEVRAARAESEGTRGYPYAHLSAALEWIEDNKVNGFVIVAQALSETAPASRDGQGETPARSLLRTPREVIHADPHVIAAAEKACEEMERLDALSGPDEGTGGGTQ